MKDSPKDKTSKFTKKLSYKTGYIHFLYEYLKEQRDKIDVFITESEYLDILYFEARSCNADELSDLFRIIQLQRLQEAFFSITSKKVCFFNYAYECSLFDFREALLIDYNQIEKDSGVVKEVSINNKIIEKIDLSIWGLTRLHMPYSKMQSINNCCISGVKGFDQEFYNLERSLLNANVLASHLELCFEYENRIKPERNSEIKEHHKAHSLTKTYLMQDKTHPCFYKIGISHDVSFRERTLSHSVPRITTIATCDTNIEKELHEYFKHKKVRGEWFKLSSDDVEYVKNKFKTH